MNTDFLDGLRLLYLFRTKFKMENKIWKAILAKLREKDV